MEVERSELRLHVDLVARQIEALALGFADLQHVLVLEELQAVLLVERRQQMMANGCAVDRNDSVVVALWPVASNMRTESVCPSARDLSLVQQQPLRRRTHM